MRWCILLMFVTVIAIVIAEPEPKKYKPEVKTKVIDTSLTDEEKKFLKEVEAKFGIKTDIPLETDNKENDTIETKTEEDTETEKQIKTPYPSVIAIEIVNDTDDKDTPTKGKRTIDANLGYGYQTNNGYTYTYFGKQSQDKPKFMIYPYSQRDIPPANTNAHSSGYSYSSQQSAGSHSGLPSVQITPSKAYELVPMKEEQTAYHYEKPSVEFKTQYDSIQSVEQQPPQYPTSETSHLQATPQTIYTTYNGHQFSGLSGRFPSVMSNYLVDSSQLLKSPQYQSAGLTQSYFQSHGAQQDQKVVPVLVLRVPSSYLKKPTAELYANTPHSVSQYLNVNLQELVNQYFRKLGYPYAPQVMAYQNAPTHIPESLESSVTSYEPNKYASPYVQPSYTHDSHSGVQYSAVQPVMAKYPAGYQQQYYTTQGRHYQQPQQQQQYVYQYKYVPQSSPDAQQYYKQLQYQQAYQQAQQPQYTAPQTYSQQQSTDQETSHEATHGHSQDASSYAQQQETDDEEEVTSVDYETLRGNSGQTYEQQTVGYEAPQATPQYETQTESSAEYGVTKEHLPTHDTQSVQVQYEQPQSVEVYNRGQAGHNNPETQTYENQASAQSGHDELPLSENYPSKDHTIATVLPLSYKSRQQSPGPVQGVSYVTPVTSPMKYHSQYRVMVPQTIFRRPTEGKVSYVNSYTAPSTYPQLQSSRFNSGQDHAPTVRLRSAQYPWNHHAHPKRMVRPQNRSDNPKTVDATEESSS